MLTLLEFFVALFAIISALKFEENLKLFLPLGCLFAMFIIGRIDKVRTQKKKATEVSLNNKMEEILKKDETFIKDQELFTIDSLLSPKSEFMLMEAVHFVFKDLKFKVSTGVDESLVDRILRIPETEMAFGLQIMMSENTLDQSHPKIPRALQFEKEKKENERTLIIASTHIHLQPSDKSKVAPVSKELVALLGKHRMTFISAYHLYRLWQKAKDGEVDIFRVFREVYSHPGGLFQWKIPRSPKVVPLDLFRPTSV
jgi:hypothetical protein